MDYRILEYLFNDYTGGADIDQAEEIEQVIPNLCKFYQERFSAEQQAELMECIESIVINNLDVSSVLDSLLLPFDIPDTAKFLRDFLAMIK